MGNILADAWRAISLQNSPLLSDVANEEPVWWRTAVGLLAGIGAALLLMLVLGGIVAIIGSVAAIAAGADPAQIENFVQALVADEIEQTWGISLSVFWVLALTNTVIFLMGTWVASLIVRKKFRFSFTMARNWRWRQLVGGMAIYGVAIAGVIMLEVSMTGEELEMPMVNLSPNVAMMVLYAVLMGGATIIAAGAEEVVFRGWLLRHTAPLFRKTWLFLLLNGVIFSAIHLDFDPNAFTARTIMGIGFCWMALRFGGVEFATGAHAANNLIILLFVEPIALSPPPPEDVSGFLMLETGLMLALMVAVTELCIRYQPIARLIGPPAEPRSPGETFS